MNPAWLNWAMQVEAIARTGHHYAKDPFDLERYEALNRIAIEMMAAYSDSAPEVIAGLFQTDHGHATPKVDVRGIVFREGKILLVMERATGKWTVPGGFADIGESAGEAVAREVLEESGYRVRPTRLLALYDRAKHAHTPIWFACYKVFLECEVIDGAAIESIETAGASFFAHSELPELDSDRITTDQLERLWRLHDHPDQAPEFD